MPRSGATKGDSSREQSPSRLELEALKVLWSLGSGTVADVRDALMADRELAYTTVLTLLDRLAGKGAVRRKKRGRSYVYRPALSREVALETALERIADDFFQGSRDRLAAYLQGSSTSPERDRHRTPDAATMDSALL